MKTSELIGPTFVEMASKALTDYMDGPDALVRDLLADLRHYCDAHNIDFADEDRVGYHNYIEELEEQP